MPTPLRDHPKGAPGSDKARANGCICAVLDNRHGLGMYEEEDGTPIYVTRDSCPVHNNGKDSLAIGLS